MLYRSISLIIVLLLVSACKREEHSTELKTVLGNYGHLTRIGTFTTSPLYLSLLKKEETYKVCLSSKMASIYPGIENEIKASINIWAHYLDRKINVEITKIYLPLATEDMSTKDIIILYAGICGKDKHLYIGRNMTDSNDKRLG